MTAAKISAAVRDCLDQCQRTEYPLANLDVFLEGLRVDPSWNESDVQQVETTVRRMLSKIKGGTE
jgi:hypothetical protein